VQKIIEYAWIASKFGEDLFFLHVGLIVACEAVLIFGQFLIKRFISAAANQRIAFVFVLVFKQRKRVGISDASDVKIIEFHVRQFKPIVVDIGGV